MRISDLFSSIQQKINQESGSITAQSTTEENNGQTNSLSQAGSETRFGVANTVDQFETAKNPKLLDHLISSSPAFDKVPDSLRSQFLRAEIGKHGQIDEPSQLPVARRLQMEMKDFLSNLAQSKEAFHSELSLMYGKNYDVAAAENLRIRVLNGDFSWLPRIEPMSNDALQGHYGASDSSSGVIYVNESRYDQPQNQMRKGMSNFIGDEYGKVINSVIGPPDSHKLLWSYLKPQLDPQDYNNIEGRSFGTIYVNGAPQIVEWVG